MSNAEEHIWQLITEKLAGVIDPEDERYLDELLYNDPSIRQAYDDMASLFPQEDVENKFARYDQDAYWSDVYSRIEQTPVKRRLPLGRLLAVAAAVAAVCFAVWLVLRPAPDMQPEIAAAKQLLHLQLASGQIIDLSQPGDINLGNARLSNQHKTLTYTANTGAPAGWNTLVIPGGQDYKIALSDGTEIWLNSATSLQFPFNFSSRSREIRLNGEAYVKVAPQSQKPFTIHTPSGTIQVLGTEFNVNTYDSGSIRVALVSGAVRLQAGGQTATLKPGTQAIYTGRTGLYTEGFEQEEVLSWRRGIYYFNEATLEDICVVLPRWFGIEVVMDNPGMADIHFTGLANRNKPISAFLENLSNTNSVEYYYDEAGKLHFK